MQETLLIRFHEIILMIYLFSIICYFVDFINKNYKTRTVGFYSLGIVWVLQTISLSIFFIHTKQVPLGSIFDVFFSNMDYYINFVDIEFD